MTSKEFLSQAFHLDQRINSKLGQISTLNDLASKCTSTITGMPHAPSQSTSPMADAVVKIVDLENQINDEIYKLVELKRKIYKVIKSVENIEYQTLLEMRYLCFKTWEDIAIDMGYTTRNVHFLHKYALKTVKI